MSKKIVFNPTEAQLARIYTLAQFGLPVRNIAESYGMGEDTFMRCRKENPALDKAIKEGMAAGNEAVAECLFTQMRNGNIAAGIFLAKIRLRMSERASALDGQGLQAAQKPEKINFTSMTPIEAARVYQQVMRGEK